jgi:hypothetical protein
MKLRKSFRRVEVDLRDSNLFQSIFQKVRKMDKKIPFLSE